MTRYLLFMLEVLTPLYRRAGINMTHLKAIVEVKLKMDNRRHLVYTSRKQNADPENTFLLTLLFYSLFGAFIAAGIFAVSSVGLAMLMFFSYLMVMITMTLITDFSSILLDTSDNTIILPRPVDSRTLFAARITHIVLYLSQISIGLSIFPLAVVAFKFGLIEVLLFVIGVVFATITSLFLTNALYLLILQFSSEEKLKNVINYFQIGMAIFIMGGYQLLPRMASKFDLENFVFSIDWWSFLVPPYWFAGAIHMVSERDFSLTFIAITLVALTAPIIGFNFVNKYLTPVFSKKLGAIAAETHTSVEKRESGTSWSAKFASWLTKSAPERAAFQLIYAILGRDRKLKLKIYPAFGYVFVFGFIFLFRSSNDLAESWERLPGSNFHILVLYLTFIILQVAIHEIPYNDEFKASWIYQAAPITQPGEILSGGLKAIVTRIFLPGFGVISILVVSIWGLRAVPDILLAFLNNMFLILMIVLMGKRMLPLSIAPSLRNQSGNFIRSMLMIFLVFVTGGLHYVASGKWMFVAGAIVVQTIVVWVLATQYRKTNWSQISA